MAMEAQHGHGGLTWPWRLIVAPMLTVALLLTVASWMFTVAPMDAHNGAVDAHDGAMDAHH